MAQESQGVAALIALLERLLRSPVAEQLRAAHRCSRLASYPNAICGTARCDGSDRLACDRKQLRRPARAAAVPRTNLCLDSSDFGLRAFDPRQIPDRPKPSKDGSPMHLCCT